MNALAFEGLHFLRPEWLWALLALPLVAWLWTRRLHRDDAWRASVDAHLLPHLLEPASNLRTRGALAAALLASTIGILALAGPSWRQVAQPSWQARTPLVIAVDLSSATAATDLPPSRLLQARAKVARLLQARDGGQVGLVAFADDAYTVAPLTDDAANVAMFLDALAPDVMPIDGHRPDRAIRHAAKLMRQAGFDRGDIVLLTDHGDASANAVAQDVARDGMRVSVIGIGSEKGAIVQAFDGSAARVALDPSSLRALASAGGGAYASIAPDDADLRSLGLLNADAANAVSTQGRAGRSWKDEGYWLLPPLMLLALFAFRRGAGVAMLCAVLVMPMGFARAQSKAPEGTLWRRADQVAAARADAGDAAYRRGDFDDAASRYDGLPGADAQYNLGNALAKQGRYEEAIAAYDRALRTQPGMQDAIANRKAVQDAMKRKPPSGDGQRDDPRSKDQQQDQKQSKGDQSQQQPKSGQQPQSQGQQQAQGQKPASPDKPADAEQQRAADAAQRKRMQQALREGREGEGKQPAQEQEAQAPRNESPEARERRLANDAWLRRVPDDPGGLLRAKFRLEHERRQLEGED